MDNMYTQLNFIDLVDDPGAFTSGEKFPTMLFKRGNIVYYHYDHYFSTQKGQKQKLINFPSTEKWIYWRLNNCDVRVVLRDYNTNEEYNCKAKLKIYSDIVTIFPAETEENPYFSSIINGEITWNVSKSFHFIYISVHEMCFITGKIMHDPSLFVDLDRNKLGVTYPVPKPPTDDKNLTFTLKIKDGEMQWVLDDNK